MQPEQSIARPHPLLDTAPRIEAINLARPSVTGFDARDTRLRNTELDCHILLHAAFGQPSENCTVASIESIHPLSLRGDDGECTLSLIGLDRQVWSGEQQKPFNIWGAGYGVAIEPPVVHHRSAIFFDAPITEASEHRVQCRAMSIGEAKPDAALVLIDFDAALTIKKPGEVARERIVAEVFHSPSYDICEELSSMAVPCMRWLGERIDWIENFLRLDAK